MRFTLLFLICFIFSSWFAFSSSLANDFSDLEETRVKVYGSEKDKKYRLDGFFIEWENWPRNNPTHNHFHFFWFANTTDYPKFKKTQVFPFFNKIESKVDPRISKNYFILYNYNVDKEGNQTESFFPLYTSGKSKNNSSYLGVFPFFYSSRDEFETNIRSTLVLPGYYQQKTTNRDLKSSESLTYSPLHYSREDAETKHQNIFWFFDRDTNKKTSQVDRIWILPIFYWKRNDYLTVFPLYFNRISKVEDTENWFGLVPPIYRSYSPNHSTFYFINYYYSKENLNTTQDKFIGFFPFYFYSDNSLGETGHMIPILYFYKKEKDRSTHKNILLLYDQGNSELGSLDRLWLSPILYYKKQDYLYFIPFYFRNTKNDEKTSEEDKASHSWFGIIPPFYRSYSPNHSTFYLLNFYRNRTESSDKIEKSTILFPLYWNTENNQNESLTLVPLIYFNGISRDKRSHTNTFMFFDTERDKDGNLERIWVFPFYFYKKSSYHYFFPFYFSNDEKLDNKENTSFGPIYYFHKNDTIDERLLFIYYGLDEKTKAGMLSRRNIFPFYYSWSKKFKKTDGFLGNEDGYSVFPLIYRNRTQDDIYTNILGFVSWTKNSSNELIQNNIFPFRFYEKNVHSIWFPFSFQFGNTEDNSESGSKWGLGFYSSWSPEANQLWILNYYSKTDIKKEEHSTTFFPLYHSWKGETSKGTLFFPIYFDGDFADETDKEKYNNVNFNILGIASQSTKGIFEPSFSVDGGKISKYYYLDTDISWLYYGFRISNRTSTKLIENILPNAKSEAVLSGVKNRPDSAKITSQRNFTREDSYNFFGVNFLFGVFGYEAADTKRHIRLLPLAWFTYDTEVDENIYAGPLPLPFVWYSSSELKYRVIFPIYGYQNSPDAKRHSYGLFLYLKEDLVENSVHERSILWPFANWHSSEMKTGSRILPIYWKRIKLDDDGSVSDSLVIPPLLTYINKTEYPQNITMNTWISPFFLRFDDVYSLGRKTTGMTTIPFYYNSLVKTKDVEDRNFLVFPFYFDKKEFKKEELVYHSHFYLLILPILVFDKPISRENTIASRHIISPLFFSTAVRVDTGEIYKESFLPIPFLYMETDLKKNTDFTGLLLLFQRANNPDKISYRFLPFFQYSKEKRIQNRESYVANWAFPFFLNVRSRYLDDSANLRDSHIFGSILFSSIVNHEKDIKLVPLIYYSSDTYEESFRSYLLFTNHTLREDFESLNVFPVFHKSKEEFASGLGTKNKEWLIPFYYYANQIYGNGRTAESNIYSLLYTQNQKYSKEGRLEDSRLVLPLLLYAKEERDSFYEWSWLFFIQSKTDKFKSSFNIAPIFHSSKREEPTMKESMDWFFPFYYISNYHLEPKDLPEETIKPNSNTKSTVRTKPDVIQRQKREDRYRFLTLLFHYSNVLLSEETNDRRTTISIPILPLIYRESSKDASHINLFFFFDQKVRYNRTERFFLFPFYYGNKNPESETSVSYYHFFPFYFSGVDKMEYTAFITGLYINNNSKESYQNLLFLGERETKETDKSSEWNFLLRSILYKTSPEMVNLRLLYGIGELDLRKNRTQMNFAWLGYENDEIHSDLNLLPIYYDSKLKNRVDSTKWITPILYYSEESNRKKLEHSALGLFYFNSENLETKESLENILFGIIYYKTVKPKERGYTGRGSLWGALWEYNTEEETNYSKFSILKILYSRREDGEGVRHRILLFEF